MEALCPMGFIEEQFSVGCLPERIMQRDGETMAPTALRLGLFRGTLKAGTSKSMHLPSGIFLVAASPFPFPAISPMAYKVGQLSRPVPL